MKTKYYKTRIWAFLNKSGIKKFCSIAFPLLVFGLILLNRSPNLLRPLSLYTRTGFASVIPIWFLFLYISFRLSGWGGRLLSLTFTMALFAFALAGLWASGQTQSTIFNGIVPLYDASAYYTDALRLLAGERFSVTSTYHPLFSGLLAVMLWVTGRNLMITLGILTAITACACYLAAREIQRTHGAEAAVFVLMILFLFYRYHSGSVMTENLGVPLGALGFALIWRGAADQKKITAWLGLFVSTLALNARPGAFLVLPFLLLWGGWAFRESERRYSWRFLIMGSGMVLAGFVVNILISRLLAAPSGVLFGNFSYMIYGLASGGTTPWVAVWVDHPEVLEISEPARSRIIYQLAFDLIRQNPALLIRGALYYWSTLFSNSWYNVYAYVGGQSTSVNTSVRWGLYILCILGFLRWFRKPKDVFSSLVIIAILGVLASVPFVPPIASHRMRPYAASIMIFGLLPAMGLVFILENLKARIFCRPDPRPIGRGVTTWFSVFLIIVTLFGPFIVRSVGQPPRFGPASCEPGNDKIVTLFDPGTYFNVIPGNVFMLDWMPNFHVGDFRRNAHSLPDSYMIHWTKGVKPPVSIFYALDYLSYNKVLLIVPSSLMPEPGAALAICGTWERDQNLENYKIFYARSLKVLSP